MKKTKKEFIPYNDYEDRGMSLKWGTAFELGELTKAIAESNKESTKKIKRLPQQSQSQIEYYLDQSIKYNKLLEIQLNTLDQLGRVQDHVHGNFRGFVEGGLLQVGESFLTFEDIRHITIHDFRKWSDLSDTPPFPFSKDEYKAASSENQRKIDRIFEDYFNDDGWVE